MADISWPVTLPQRLRADGFSESLADGAIRTEMDEGPAKVRKLPTAAYDQIKGKILVTSAQWTLLKTFYKDTTSNGVLPFTWVDMVDQSQAVDYRFTKPPSIVPMEKSQFYLASLQLERVA